MPIDYSAGGEFAKLPKVGAEPQEYKIKECKRIDEPKHRMNFKKREARVLDTGEEVMVDVDQGFRYEYTLEDGRILTIGSWKPFYAFADANVQEGSYIRVHHPAEGEWRVELLNKTEHPSSASSSAATAWDD